MIYVCIVLFAIVIVLAVFLCHLYQGVSNTSMQMEEIEKHPEQNRELRALTTNKVLEKLLNRINYIYRARQRERIVYQRRETQIRREIENISHDLRTPLTSIIGYADLIKDPKTNNKEREEYLNIIQKRARVLQGFIQDFYELSRIEGDNYPTLLESIKVQEALSEVAVAYYHEFEKRQIQVEVTLDEKSCFIIADKIQFNRIINNLVQNALKYAGRHFILKQTVKNGECILQFMNDKGQMKEEDLKLIFDRFYTCDLSRSNQSTGLGLTIAKTLTENMKGTIEARLEGDLFTIEIRFKQIG